ncbi:hypothetical protein HY469_00320 [Candidatus Roizmanbacteria bacterium]|nr:hypothetical protein [Candidatus Roizmanbacteria bacterium]
MGQDTIFQISLVASYIAGIVALFAPCCISYLFPAYIGNVFKERGTILGMTFVYSLGILVIMLPIVLGARALSTFFFRFHDQMYLFGSFIMIVVAFISLLGLKLPMPHPAITIKNKHDVASTFLLGLVSGITSACCAPVLLGVITLSAFSPTLIQSLLVGVFYVFGMVTPLYIASIFIKDKNILEKPWIKKQVNVITIGSQHYQITMGNVIAFIVFFTAGLAMYVLTLMGKTGMTVAQSASAQYIQSVALSISEITSKFFIIDILFIGAFGFVVYTLIRRQIKRNL